MPLLAYVDLRPFIFVGGLPFVIGLVVLAGWAFGIKWHKGKVAFVSSLIFTGLFALLLTGFGPFIDKDELRDYEMTWTIQPSPSRGMNEAEVVLEFAEFPEYFVGIYSDELAAYLKESAEDKITARFRVTYDYGKVRAYNLQGLDGLSKWKFAMAYGGVRGSPEKSPWD